MTDYLMKYGILDLMDKYMDDCIYQNKTSLIEVIPKGTSDYHAMRLFLERCSTDFEPKDKILDKERTVIKEYSRYNKIEKNSRRKIQHDKIVINNARKNNVRSDGSVNEFNHRQLSDIKNYGIFNENTKTNPTNATANTAKENQEKIKINIQEEKHPHAKQEDMLRKSCQLQEYLLFFKVFKKQIDDYLQNKQVVDVDFLMKNTDLNRLLEIIPSMKLKLEFGIWLRLQFNWTSIYFFRTFGKKVYGISHETIRKKLIQYDIPYKHLDFREEENIHKITFDVENFIN